MLTKSGAKLLDFGLAKTAAEGPAPLDGLTSLPTEAKPLTEEGTILGTFQYMAPEQLEGLEADARTDIFALGAVLYEMATGQRAFQGGSKTSLIAEIVASQPAPISTVIEMAPPALDHVVQRCLEKDPDDRWQSVHDVASELQWISEAGSQADAGKATVASPTSKRRVLTSVAVAGWIIAATFTWALMQRTSAEVSPRSFRAELVLQEDTSRSRLSPDGKWIIYSSDESGLREIYLSDFPAGRMKWQVTQRNLKGVAFDDFGGAEWGPRGDAVFYKTESGIVKVPVRRSGDRLGPGSPELIEFDTSRIFGRFKPDGETFLALTPAGDLKEEPIQIIWNWRQMLERSNP